MALHELSMGRGRVDASCGAGVHTNNPIGYCEERIARYLELAEAAQEAAGRASQATLEETYAQLARQWIELARMAERTIHLSREISAPADNHHPTP